VTAPAGFDGHATRRDYYFKTRNGAREFRFPIKRWKAEQKSPADTLSFDDSDKRWLAHLRAHVGDLELLPAIVTHWERTAKPIGVALREQTSSQECSGAETRRTRLRGLQELNPQAIS
jgi:hypothetical protein